MYDDKKSVTDFIDVSNKSNILYNSSTDDNFSTVMSDSSVMELELYSGPVTWPQSFQCYMAQKDKREEEYNKKVLGKVKAACCKRRLDDSKTKCPSAPTTSSIQKDLLPLSKVLCNFKEVSSIDRKCTAKLKELIETEKYLKEQILQLERREEEGVALLKQADSMWTCMEDTYKKKIADSISNQNQIHSKLFEVEKSASKWRNKKKELEIELSTINKKSKDIKEKIHQKSTELKMADNEIENLKKKIQTVKQETKTVNQSHDKKKTNANKKVQSITNEVNELQKVLEEAKKSKTIKEQESMNLIKDVRDDFTKINKVLLLKQIQLQDLQSEKEGFNEEIKLLSDTLAKSDSVCKTKKDNITNEIARLNKEISEFKVKCIQCNQCIDTNDIRAFCIDCPRCAKKRECLRDQNSCYQDHLQDCICTRVKNRFFENVFENMNSVLQKQTDTCAGKALSEAVLKCLKRSRNGKLDQETRRIVKDYILVTIKNNLNITVVGGAIKTRCELDPTSYQQLMLCINKIPTPAIKKADKAVDIKRDPCARWGGKSECNCLKGPKDCICRKSAGASIQNRTESNGICTRGQFKSSCRTHSLPPKTKSAENSNVTPSKEQSSTNKTTKTTKTTTQYFYEPELLKDSAKSLLIMSEDSNATMFAGLDISDNCICEKSFDPTCPLHADLLNRPREQIIDEVFGKFTEISPVQKVLSYDCIDLNDLS